MGDDTKAGIRALACKGRLKNVSGTLINFYQPQDDATKDAWEFNNSVMKPYEPLDLGIIIFQDATLRYDYRPTKFWEHERIRLEKVAIDKDVFGNEVIEDDRQVRKAYEVMSMVNQSRTKTVGAEGRTQGKIARSINIGEAPYNFNTEHSAEFNRDIQQLRAFYRELKNRL